ncbi:MAG: hypothetical protein J1E81_09560, partial [Eubacterium sp.]|nr:hypothetical protein [Eubacterium sp.]
LSDKRFSRPPRYDHFDTSAFLLNNINTVTIPCQDFFEILQKLSFYYRLEEKNSRISFLAISAVYRYRLIDKDGKHPEKRN